MWSKKTWLFQDIIVFVTIVLVETGAVASILPFSVEGNISIEAKMAYRTNTTRKSLCKFLFFYSNGWWEVETTYSNAAPNLVSTQNCMQIPDGTRTYTLFNAVTNAGMTMAVVCPNYFPPPGKLGLFVAWLSLCPHPRLPLINDHSMRRFINIPDCQTEVFQDPRNQGAYNLQFLRPDNEFVSSLCISNNGIWIDLTVNRNAEVEGEFVPIAGFLKDGFLETEYKILETTNANGIVFPFQTEYKRFAPRANPASLAESTNLDNPIRILLTVESINFSATKLDRIPVAPSKLLAIDCRAPNLPKNHSMDYIVDRDQWKAVSDPRLIQLAELARYVRPAKSKLASTCVRILILLVVLAPLLTLIYKKLKPQQTHNI